VTYEETYDGIYEHEDHHPQYQALIQLFCCYAHQSGPDSQLDKADCEQIDRLVDEVDEHPILVIFVPHVTPMPSSSVSGLYDRHCEADD
jgi:hypothetical protein